jgi:hypothetical protein
MTIMIHILCVFIYFITEKIVGPECAPEQTLADILSP